ncbi:tetratricopeptide repeat protein [Streptomyces asoensis]|uniref:Tetratricopeptide repeat protein n=1 Tax=Streptomyces asoensis TaxID=249586 RepID=A0A6M4WS96_9ACTN|nr:tetratricopeptide repeat protein [Streptomyces asoensis]QJT03414.1 tetratricopeptide repeat protein [Streptomyces asoensis]
MSRLSREKKREQKYAGPTAVVVAPLDVHVRGGGTATIGGVPVVAADGEEIQRAVLSHLHRIALATGHPVLATVHDERIGYVVALRVDPDGSSHFTADPLRTAAAAAPSATARKEAAPDTRSTEPTGPPAPVAAPADPPAPVAAPADPPAPIDPPAPVAFPAPADAPVCAAVPAPADAPVSVDDEPSVQPRRDKATHFLRPVSEPVRDATPTFPLRAVPEPEAEREARSAPESAPTYAAGETPAPGTVTAPTGVFGPPPTMDEQPNPDATPISTPTAARTSTLTPVPTSAPIPLPLPTPASAPTPTTKSGSTPTPFLPDDLISDSAVDLNPDPKPTPARGFDAVAEAVLGDDPRTLHGDGGTPALLAEPLARINEAVRAGRTDTAAALAERTVLEASGTLGPEHPEVLRLRELTAYIAYLAGDPVRSFHTSLDLARIHRRTRDAEAAYGNVQSAKTAWRAVRDPLQGLNLGTELLGLWTELTTEEGPAADDVEELESARARMLRLAERARKSGA